MQMMNRAAAVNALRQIADAIVESVKVAGAVGAPESSVYLALMAHGGTLETHQAFVGALVAAGRLRCSGHLLFAV